MRLLIKEINVGVADEEYPIEVKADNRKECTKKLKRYLENFYEDDITFLPCKDYIEASFVRNGGKLKITYV